VSLFGNERLNAASPPPRDEGRNGIAAPGYVCFVTSVSRRRAGVHGGDVPSVSAFLLLFALPPTAAVAVATLAYTIGARAHHTGLV
jgi:hypothetical protein